MYIQQCYKAQSTTRGKGATLQTKLTLYINADWTPWSTQLHCFLVLCNHFTLLGVCGKRLRDTQFLVKKGCSKMDWQLIASAIAIHILNHAKKSLKLHSKKEPDNIAVEVPMHLMSAHRRVYIWEDCKKCSCLCNTMSMRYAEVRKRWWYGKTQV